MKTWNKVYKRKKQFSEWPFTDLVSLVNNQFKSRKKNCEILELGFGFGSNIPFFVSKRFFYTGIEQSEVAVDLVKRKFKNEKQVKIINQNFTKPFDLKKKFDLIIDRGSLTHNSLKEIESAIKNINFHLKSGGMFISVDLFSINHSDFKSGKVKDDFFTRVLRSKKYKNSGKLHFFNEKKIRKLFKQFKIINLSQKRIISFNKKKNQYSFWNLVVKKK